MSCAVQLRDVSVSYYEHVALRGVTLDLHRGDFAAIVGPNGAGKTTLLTVINGLGNIRSGTVRILDTPLDRNTVRGLRRRIGYVPQHLNVDQRSPISCREAVMLGRVGRAGIVHRLTEKDRAVTERSLEMTGLMPLADRPVGHLSGGEARKVELARALAQEPEILLLDEPYTNLDIRASAELEALVTDAHERFSLTTVLVTHRIDRLPDRCNRVVLMNQAHIIFDGSRDDALAPKRVAALFA